MTTIEKLKERADLGVRNSRYRLPERVHVLLIQSAAELEALQGEVESLSNELALRIGDKLEITSLRAQNQTLRNCVEYVAGLQNLFFAECSQAEEIVQRCKQALAQSQEGKS